MPRSLSLIVRYTEFRQLIGTQDDEAFRDVRVIFQRQDNACQGNF